MFQTASGVSLPFPEKLRNEYQIHPCFVQLTPSFEKIQPLLLDFIAQLEEPLFVVLEMPVNREEEELLRKQDADPFHKKVCYLDGQSQEQVLHIIAQYGKILLNDGLSQFAVASHVTGDDFFIQKYKLVNIYSKSTDNYIALLEKHGFAETSDLFTPWDSFSREHPGSAWHIQYGGKGIYDVYQTLEELGMYVGKVEEA